MHFSAIMPLFQISFSYLHAGLAFLSLAFSNSHFSPRYNNHDPKPLSRKTQGLFYVWRWAFCYSAPSLSLLPSYFKAQLRRKEKALWTFGPKSSKKLAPSWWKSSSASLKKWKTMIEQNTVKRRFYVVPPLNDQYEEVQPDLHSLERYDFSKMPDLPWYP